MQKNATPRFKPPPLSCDAHCHVFGPAAKFPYDPKAAYVPEDAPFEKLKELHSRLGLERAVIVHASCHGADMRVTLDAIARSGGRFRGTAIIDSSVSEKDFERMHAGGIRGVRFNFVRHLGGRPDMAFFNRTVERLKSMGWHLILHLDAQDLVEFEDLFRKIPVPMVIDHMGRVKAAEGLDQTPFRVLLGWMKQENFWVKVCGSERVSSKGPPFADAVPFARALIDAAPDRILWGTDWPHPNVKWLPDDAALLDLFPLMAPDPALQKRILVDNPARLYGFQEIAQR
ncbi:MAG: 2-pyrone-4,6-dicarboxylate hydrolase [Burkholderiales bacterium]|nr:2-pyrone-4,6-dicarboxylate hydrolase [Burkholderiales bacterium]